MITPKQLSQLLKGEQLGTTTGVPICSPSKEINNDLPKKPKTFQRKRLQTGQDSSRFVGVPKCSPQADVPPRFIWHVSVESFSRRVNLEHSLLGRFGLGFHRVKSQKGSWHLKAKRCLHSGDLNSVFTGAVSFLAPGTLFLSFILVLPFF